MHFKRIFCMRSIWVIFMVFCLFLAVGNASAQCIPGERVNDPHVPAGIEQPWSGDKVPASILPPGLPPNAWNYFMYLADDFCGVPGHWGCYSPTWDPGWHAAPGGNDFRYVICWNEDRSCVLYDYEGISRDGNVLDYDCDGLPDSVDSDPATPEHRDKNQGHPRCDLSAGKNVNVATGNAFEGSLDVGVSASGGIPFDFRISYNSQSGSDGPLGYGGLITLTNGSGWSRKLLPKE
jgi:hypothetical protein